MTLLFACGEALGEENASRAVEKHVIELVNRARVNGIKCGNSFHKEARPLAWNATLGAASLKHSSDMAQKGGLSHTGHDGNGPKERLASLGYRWSSFGENVGEGFESPEEAVESWLKSERHCRNIMNPAFREAGAAYAKRGGRTYWTLLLTAPEHTSFISP